MPILSEMHPLSAMHRGARRAGLILALPLALAFLAGCESNDEEVAFQERPVEELYNQAFDQMIQGNYQESAKLFDEVERQHPYSQWASKAQVMAAFAHYQRNAYDDSINALDRFIQLHPGNEDIAYAYYLRALGYYEQISDVGRDQGMTQLALNSLDELVRRFPDSKYARDASLKIDLARDHLAGKHMEIGRFYQNQSEYLGAINRFRVVIDQYQTTTHVPEALHRLVECYIALGIYNEAQSTAAVLGHNFPGSAWYGDSYAMLVDADLEPEVEVDEDSWISQAWDSVF